MIIKQLRGRFAPSPSGRMHLGNVYAAVMSWASVRSRGGEWLLRIEDLDAQRCRPEYAAKLIDDLRWLGFSWEAEPLVQSARGEVYERYFEQLKSQNLVYPCFCSRADILAARAPHASDGIVVYGGRCKHFSPDERAKMAAERQPSWRIAVPEKESEYRDRHFGTQKMNLSRDCGDFILRRADGNFAYQLAVVVDDALSGISEVVRGCDLLNSAHQQIFLYEALGLEVPEFAHVPLLLAHDGRRLAKRDAQMDLAYLRERKSAEQIIGQIAYFAGQTEHVEALSLGELTQIFDWTKVPKSNVVVD